MRQLSSKSSCHKQDQKKRIGSRVFDALRSLGRLVSKLANLIFDERHTLERLNDHQLRDIGLTRDRLYDNKSRCMSELATSTHPDVSYLQGALQGQYRRQLRRLPRD